MSKERIEQIITLYNGHMSTFNVQYQLLATCEKCGATYKSFLSNCEKCGIEMHIDDKMIILLDELDASVKKCINALKKLNMRIGMTLETGYLEYLRKICTTTTRDYNPINNK